MDDFYDMLISFNYELVKKVSITTPNSSPLPNSKIDFKFSFNSETSKWILGQDDEDESQLVYHSSNPEIDYIMSVGFDRFSSTEETRKYMQEKLSDLPVGSDDRRNLVDYAMYEASSLIKKGYTSLSLHFNVLLQHVYIYLHEQINDVYESTSTIRMVPAKDSSIQVLKKVAAAEYSRRNMDCSICLEKVSGGSDNREALSMPCSHVFHDDCIKNSTALSMPCSHVFHDDCIKNWLRVSHYCPLCRFEMPAD